MLEKGYKQKRLALNSQGPYHEPRKPLSGGGEARESFTRLRDSQWTLLRYPGVGIVEPGDENVVGIQVDDEISSDSARNVQPGILNLHHSLATKDEEQDGRPV